MAKYSLFICFALAAIGLAARAGNDSTEVRPALRKDFRQQDQYPYIFVPVAHLENGPVPMRFGAPANDSSPRVPPPAPSPTPSPTPKPAPSAPEQPQAAQSPTPNKAVIAAPPVKYVGQPEPSPTPGADPSTPVSSGASPAPEYPPPDAGPTPIPQGQADFEQMPDEVLDFFRNPYNSAPNSHRLFDPIFEPATTQKAPPSKATYKQE